MAESTKTPIWQPRHRMAMALEASGVKVAEMARVLDVDRNTIGNYLHGRTSPNAATMRVWAMRCGVDFNWLMTGETPSEGGGSVTSTDTLCYQHSNVAQLTLFRADQLTARDAA